MVVPDPERTPMHEEAHGDGLGRNVHGYDDVSAVAHRVDALIVGHGLGLGRNEADMSVSSVRMRHLPLTATS